jgi:hypothetical protein
MMATISLLHQAKKKSASTSTVALRAMEFGSPQALRFTNPAGARASVEVQLFCRIKSSPNTTNHSDRIYEMGRSARCRMVVAKFIIGCIGHASGLVYCAYQHLGEVHGKQSADHGQSGRQARVDCHTPACDARPQKIVSRTRSTFFFFFENCIWIKDQGLQR